MGSYGDAGCAFRRTATLPSTMSIWRRNRPFLRATVFAAGFLFVILFNVFINSFDSSSDDTRNAGTSTEEIRLARRLESPDTPCDEVRKAEPAWLAVFMFLGVCYMFLAIALVCDELFVPALEVIADKWQLSMDVAGATLMAAGGSAPELFTSIFGTFVQQSEVGIGTVVGSAVFNVLFVIAMCSLLSHELLKLTWWPLFRDATYYAFGLIVLGIFIGVVSPGLIEWWEAMVLFLMYIGYVVLMRYNRALYTKITGKELVLAGEEEAQEHTSEDGVADGEDRDTPGALPQLHQQPEHQHDDGETHMASGLSAGAQAESRGRRMQLNRDTSARSILSARSKVSALTVNPPIPEMDGDGGNGSAAPWPATFRSGIIKLLRSDNLKSSWKDTAGVGIVAVVAGDCRHVFRKVDVDDNGEIDREELAQLFAKLDCDIDESQMDMIMEELDANKDGKITEQDFTRWYVTSEERIASNVKKVFDFFDTNQSGTINRDKIKSLLETVEPSVTDQDVEQAMEAMYQSGSRQEITFEEFKDWYVESMLYQRQVKKVEDDMEVLWDNMTPPSCSDRSVCSCIWAYVKYVFILPIVLVLGLTVPDVRKPGWQKWCYLSFMLSIGWIGFFSFFMVDWAEIIGHTIGIPVNILLQYNVALRLSQYLSSQLVFLPTFNLSLT